MRKILWYEYFCILIILAFLIFLSGLLASAIRIADQWERAVVLRMGKYKGLKGPGPFMIIPLTDAMSKEEQLVPQAYTLPTFFIALAQLCHADGTAVPR